ncbi:hypothetical protein BABINDRAFT_163078 [Babjeviella inositovora NRRL Y-12698]|uniref:DUF4259 domain-containing protein n=1 Tax=Babjeviella inositovora NRRL Y-12698 TaxID=984486 RepID=A0A1E3QKQ9_9ASCO|nr:uncharacterized protein BABINDRAFT_163078 [Babjeviella inositovora NRRL Y-12698]ODQ78044.1 hypothetical protein BABINDRAFT_163078 [Babjeviella inositovora NRRL Y-12698]
MGAWGYGYFDNDSTCNALSYLCDGESDSVKGLVALMEDALQNDYIEDNFADSILTAILLTLWRSPSTNGGLLDEAFQPYISAYYVEKMRVAAEKNRQEAEKFGLENLTKLCKEALTRILDPKHSEPADLWSETGSERFEIWKRSITQLQGLLKE